VERSAPVRIWDPLVRVFHWSLAAAVIATYWFTDPGSDVHNWIGYGAAVVVLARGVWGLVGRGHARFSDFTPTPARLREHLDHLRARSVPVDTGHNPLGALMIYAVFALVAVLTVTGFLHEEIDALYGNDFLQETHEIAAHALWICALIHVASVFAVQWFGRVELLRPMITGWRRPRD
jgi:cytochrome b